MSGIFGPDANVDLSEYGAPGLAPLDSQVRGAERNLGVLGGPTFNILADVYNWSAEMAGVPKLNRKQWEEKGYNVPGVNFDQIASSDGLVNEASAQLYANRQRQENNANRVIEESPDGQFGITRLLGGAEGFLSDPLNIAATAAAGPATGALGDLATGAINGLAERTGISEISQVASNEFVKAAVRDGVQGGVSVSAQALGNFADDNQSWDSAAMSALNTLAQGVVLGAGARVVGKGIKKLNPFRALPENAQRYLGLKTNLNNPVLDVSLVGQKGKLDAMNMALAQAVADKPIDVMDLYRADYNLQRGENVLSDVADSKLYESIAPAMKNLVEPIPEEGDILSTLKSQELQMQQEVEQGLLAHSEYMRNLPDRINAFKTALDDENPEHQTAIKVLEMMNAKPTFHIDPDYQIKLIKNLQSKDPATFNNYQDVEGADRESLEGERPEDLTDELEDRLQSFKSREDLTDFDRNHLDNIDELRANTEEIPKVYENLKKCLLGAAGE